MAQLPFERLRLGQCEARDAPPAREETTMQYIRLSAAGLKVSRLALGCTSDSLSGRSLAKPQRVNS
jgi:hypothetical protein